MKLHVKNGGFTLVEVMLAVSISVMVFFAMGMVLSKCFSLWKDATANWRLAQYARISRERILCGVTNYVAGGATNQTGLLSASNAVITLSAGWSIIEYSRLDEPGVAYQIRGWSDTADDKNIQIRRGAADWVYGQSSGSAQPEIKVDSFTAAASNDIVIISYRLRTSIAGRTFTQPQTISAWLVNREEDE